MASKFGLRASDLHGLAALATDATVGVTRTVEAMHSRIADVATGAALHRQPSVHARGITGFVYRRVRATAAGVGRGAGLAFKLAARWRGAAPSSPARDAVLAAVNGVFGDHLVTTSNPLALPMQLCVDGLPWRDPLVASTDAGATQARAHRLVVLVHGLCMSPGQSRRAHPADANQPQHDHGAALARDFAVQPVYAFYNSGCSIGSNAAALAKELAELVAHWPVPVAEISLVGHSMGGLVARGALWHAAEANLPWRRTARRLMCLGTPHHGAPLEHLGTWVDAALAVSRFSAPLAKLTLARSVGIQDLRSGRIWPDGMAPGTAAGPPLPLDVACYALAGRLTRVNETTQTSTT
jgi:hypothetical protein